MFIRNLELKGYKRLALNNIDFFRMTPVNKIQLILGTNGSGKSSILSQLSPLPAIHTDFNKGGYKLIEIEHNNSEYILRSSIDITGNKFSFIKDGEELNQGGTVTVYKELVKQYFNITQDIHDLLSGNTLFHSMSTNDRRKWLTTISDSDYTYAFMYYNNLKDQLRDIQNLLKINQARLVQETDKLLSDNKEIEHRERVTELSKFIDILLESKTTFIDRQNVRNELNQLELTMSNIANELMINNKIISSSKFNTLSEIDSKLIEFKSKLLSNDNRSLAIFNEIDERRSNLKALQNSVVDSICDVDETVDVISAEISQLESSKNINLKFDDPSTVSIALQTIKDQLFNIFTELPDNKDRLYSRDNYSLLLEQKNKLLLDISTLDQQQLKLINGKTELEHKRDHNQTECPRCKFKYAIGYDLDTFNDLVKHIEFNASKLERMNLNLLSINKGIEDNQNYIELFKQYRTLCFNWSILNPLWEYLADDSIIYDNPKQVLQIVNDVIIDIGIDIKIQSLIIRVKDAIKVKDLINDNKELDQKSLLSIIDSLEAELYQIADDKKILNNEIKIYESYRTSIIRINELTKSLESILEARSDKSNTLLASIKQEALNESIRVLQLELNQKEQLLSKVDIQKAIIENIQSQINELSTKQEVLKIAIKELSPTEGLIAKGLTSFINNFVRHINDFISKIWLYPLELIPILPDEKDDVDLDYKFAVRINDQIDISDITKGSSAMREVINLAFRIVSAKFLGLDEAPIYLDEISHSFDKAHRDAAFYVISNLMLTSSFTQIFLVSHYEQSYGSLKNTDICVLNSANIVIPEDCVFNKHVIMS